MPLSIDDIRPGCVAYLNTEVLLRDSRLVRAGTDMFRSGPFLCAAVLPGRTVWLELTSQPGRTGRRFCLNPRWVLGGSPRWRAGPTYVHDLRQPFIGRDVVFADAARDELSIVSQNRPYVAAEGVAVIRRAMVHATGLEFPVEMC